MSFLMEVPPQENDTRWLKLAAFRGLVAAKERWQFVRTQLRYLGRPILEPGPHLDPHWPPASPAS